MLDKSRVGRLVSGPPRPGGALGSNTLQVPGMALAPAASAASAASAAPAAPADFIPPSAPPPPAPVPQRPRTDWFQTGQKVSLIIYAKNLPGPQSVAATLSGNSLQVAVYDPQYVYEYLCLYGGPVKPESLAVHVSKYSATVTALKAEAAVGGSDERSSSVEFSF